MEPEAAAVVEANAFGRMQSTEEVIRAVLINVEVVVDQYHAQALRVDLEAGRLRSMPCEVEACGSLLGPGGEEAEPSRQCVDRPTVHLLTAIAWALAVEVVVVRAAPSDSDWRCTVLDRHRAATPRQVRPV